MALPSLVGKVAVITGASRGLGHGLAVEFAARGMRLGLCARSPIEGTFEADTVCAEVDVARADEVARFGDQVAKALGPIDLWINNAGVLAPIGPLRDADSKELLQHLEINVLGVMNGSATFARHRRAAGPGGTLINISSGAGRRGYFGWGAYCAGKAAVDRLSECVALEEADAGLKVHAVAPGIIDTAMQELIRGSTKESFPEVDRFLALKRNDQFSTPAFVAARLLELVYDPAHMSRDVLTGLPLEK